MTEGAPVQIELMISEAYSWLSVISIVSVSSSLARSASQLAICSTQRRFLAGRPFFLGWLGFSLIALPVGLAQWLIACAYLTALVPIRDSLIQATVTIALFPVVAAPLMLLAQRLGREQTA